VVLFDVKHVDNATHRAHTGVGNELILANLRRLAARSAPVIIRVPLIPGFNATVEQILALGEMLVGLDGAITRVDVLPYHTLARAKYAALARPYPWQGQAGLSDEEVESLAGELRGMGLTVTVGG